MSTSLSESEESERVDDSGIKQHIGETIFTFHLKVRKLQDFMQLKLLLINLIYLLLFLL